MIGIILFTIYFTAASAIKFEEEFVELLNSTEIEELGYDRCFMLNSSAEDPIKNSGSGEFLRRKKFIEWIAYRIIGPTVVGIGLLGNLLNLIVLTRPSMKGVTYTYLIWLACSDTGVLLCAVSMLVREAIRSQNSVWDLPIAFFYAYLEHPLSNIFMASSIFIVICLTVDRFASVCLPTKFKSMNRSQHARNAIIVCYIIAFIVSLPLYLLKRLCVPMSMTKNDVKKLSFEENGAITTKLAWKVYVITSEIIVRFAPAIILAVLNIMIIIRFLQITRKRKEILNGSNDLGNQVHMMLRGQQISKKIYKEEKRLVILLMAIVLLFFVTTTPVAFLSIFYSDRYSRSLPFQIFRAVANLLELCNFSLNFYVYFLCSKEFRKKFLSFFTFLLKGCKREPPLEAISLPKITHNVVRYDTANGSPMSHV